MRNQGPKIKPVTPYRITELTAQYAKANRLKVAAARKEVLRSKELAEIAEALRAELVANKLESVRIGNTNYTVSNRQIAELYDDESFFAYVLKSKRTELLHRRVTMEAARDLWTQGVEIPGVRPGTLPTLSVTKAR